MKSLLEVELYRYENLLFGRVLNQDESITRQCVTDGSKVIYSSDKVKIFSDSHPYLYMNELHIRGTSSKRGGEIFTYKYSSAEAAEEAALNIKTAIAIINAKGVSNSSVIKII